jgi:hypothetical protein
MARTQQKLKQKLNQKKDKDKIDKKDKKRPAFIKAARTPRSSRAFTP